MLDWTIPRANIGRFFGNQVRAVTLISAIRHLQLPPRLRRITVLGAAWAITFAGATGLSPYSSTAWAEEAPATSKEDRPAAKMDSLTALQAGPVFLDRVIDATEYLIGPGDGLRIGVVGEAPITLDVVVTPEATVVLPIVGAESVRGKTLAEVRDDLTKLLKGYYPRSTVTVSLTEVRRFRVTVSGAVRNPGLHIVTANTRASEVLSLAGLNDHAGLRSIRLMRDGEESRVDLIAFERLGRRAANPYLTEGDIINVPERNPRWGTIEVAGAVNSPIQFEFAPGETVQDLLELAYGLAPNADTTFLELWRFHPGESVSRRYDWPAGSKFGEWRRTALLPDDRLIVRGVDQFREKLSVQVIGEVRRAGVYIFPKVGVPLHEVIDSAGGFTPEADLEHASIIRSASQNWLIEYEKRVARLPADLLSRSETDWMSARAMSEPGRISTDFVRLFKGGQKEYDVILSDKDLVIVPPKVAFINVIGRVVQPGLVTYRSGGDLNYYLERVGGYSWRADRGGTFIVKAGTGTALRKDDVKMIEPGDLVVVPTKREKHFWNGVKETLLVASSLATIYLVIHQATR